ncbi:MAG: ATP synthase F0 subunit B [Planctomycetota bacterium]
MSCRLFRWFGIAVVCLSLTAMAPVMASAAAAPHEGDVPAVEHHPTGLPMSWTRDLALFSLVTFVVYLAVLRVGAWGPLRAGLTERERRIRQDIADAEANRLKSERMLKEHEARLAKVQEEVREILAEARRDAEHAKLEIATIAQKEAEATKQRAIAEIVRSKDQALAELFDFVSNNVLKATEQVIGRSLTGTDHERLVKESLSQLNVRRN